MIARIHELESAARLATAGNWKESDPLPPGPNYGPFGYFRLALIFLAILVVVLLVFSLI